MKVTHLSSIISGTSLPINHIDAAVVEHEDSFVIIGGRTGNGDTDKIYRYNASSGGWTEVQSTLSEARYILTAMKVKASAFDSCNIIG